MSPCIHHGIGFSNWRNIDGSIILKYPDFTAFFIVYNGLNTICVLACSALWHFASLDKLQRLGLHGQASQYRMHLSLVDIIFRPFLFRRLNGQAQAVRYSQI